LESYFPVTNDVVAFIFLAKVPRVFGWEKQYYIEQFGFNVNAFVKDPLAFTWAFPELNCFLVMRVKPVFKVIEVIGSLSLEQMR